MVITPGEGGWRRRRRRPKAWSTSLLPLLLCIALEVVHGGGGARWPWHQTTPFSLGGSRALTTAGASPTANSNVKVVKATAADASSNKLRQKGGKRVEQQQQQQPAPAEAGGGSLWSMWRKRGVMVVKGDEQEKKDKEATSKKNKMMDGERETQKEKKRGRRLVVASAVANDAPVSGLVGQQQKQEAKKEKRRRKEGSSSEGYLSRFMDELRYRLNGLDSYRHSVVAKVDASLERFQQRSKKASKALVKDVDQQLQKALALHEWYMDRINQQQQRLAELTRTEIRQRQQTFNQSLEQFKKSYDETLSQLKPNMPRGFLTKAELKAQQQRLDETFNSVMAQYMNSTTELRNYIEKIMSFSGDLLPKLSLEEDQISGLMRRLREQQKTGMASLGKLDLRIEKARWEEAVELLRAQQEKVMKGFAMQANDMEKTMKQLRQKLLTFNQLYDELITRKETKLYVETMNDKVLKRVLDCLDQTEADGWEFVTESRGIRVHRKALPSLDGKMSNYCCVKATGMIDAAPDTVLKLFEDNARVAEYNKFYAEGKDLEEINESTKVVWAASPPMFWFKPRDFCTVVHYRKLQDGTVCVVNRGAEHPDAPRTSRYVRAEILMGANIIQPVPNEPNKCIFTIVTQVDPGGFAPPVLVNKVSALGPLNFFRDLEAACKRPPPKGAPMVNKDFKL